MGKVGCLFIILRVDNSLRINGLAYVSIDRADLAYSSGNNNPAKSVIIINIEAVYLHCDKALTRSKLWDTSLKQKRSVLPSMSKMITDQVGDRSGVETHSQILERYKLKK
jgi:predicted pyridoxine 5'-phosphate oxidase superfamily flavin-nucleotide-binding protein